MRPGRQDADQHQDQHDQQYSSETHSFSFGVVIGWIQFAGAEAGGITITVVPSPDLPVAPVLPVAPSLPVAPWGPAGPGTATGVAGTLMTVGFLSQAASVSVAISAKISVEFFIGNPFKTCGADEFWLTESPRNLRRLHTLRRWSHEQ
jgi:hypothetical protein